MAHLYASASTGESPFPSPLPSPPLRKVWKKPVGPVKSTCLTARRRMNLTPRYLIDQSHLFCYLNCASLNSARSFRSTEKSHGFELNEKFYAFMLQIKAVIGLL